MPSTVGFSHRKIREKVSSVIKAHACGQNDERKYKDMVKTMRVRTSGSSGNRGASISSVGVGRSF